MSSQSIQFRINLSLVLVFFLVLAGSLTAIYRSEAKLTRDVAELTTLATADSYFDSINILMLSGAMANRSTLQKKILSNQAITEARIIRGDAVKNMYGPGSADAVVMDDLDKRALGGEHIVVEQKDQSGHRLTVVTPMKALESYKGTNCLTCHPVKSGTVLGAVRVTYDFAQMDADINRNLVNIALVEVIMFIAGILLVAFMIRRIVAQPLSEVSSTLEELAETNDLSVRLPVVREDEVGKLSRSVNKMLESFQVSLKKVHNTLDHLFVASDQIRGIADRALSSSDAQIQMSHNVSSAMIQMHEAGNSVEGVANKTLNASQIALHESQQGSAITSDAQTVMHELSARITGASDVIRALDDQSQNVGSVLSVIQQIAEQTNLLALNAAIEAARAGEQGRGFSVVADEVRKLAKRTQEATEEIQNIVSGLQAGARNAVEAMDGARASAESSEDQVQKTASALTTISREVQDINSTNLQVVDAVQAQRNVGSEVESQLGAISSNAENTTERANELANVSQHLLDLSRELRVLIDQFKM